MRSLLLAAVAATACGDVGDGSPPPAVTRCAPDDLCLECRDKPDCGGAARRFCGSRSSLSAIEAQAFCADCHPNLGGLPDVPTRASKPR